MIFWILNIKRQRIFECETVNDKKYKINKITNFSGHVYVQNSDFQTYDLNLICTSDYGQYIMEKKNSEVYYSMKEIKDRILLEKL